MSTESYSQYVVVIIVIKQTFLPCVDCCHGNSICHGRFSDEAVIWFWFGFSGAQIEIKVVPVIKRFWQSNLATCGCYSLWFRTSLPSHTQHFTTNCIHYSKHRSPHVEYNTNKLTF